MITENIILHGRSTVYNGKISMDWVGDGFGLEFIGTSIRVFFETEADKSADGVSPIYIYSELDGKKQKTSISSSKDVLVIDGLDYGRHSFKVLRATEVYSPIDDVKDYLFAAAVEIGETDDCRICDIQSAEKPIIDFYGDSITNAWASLAKPDNEQKRICDNDYTVSYAYLVTKALNAEARVCAISGRGIVANCFGDRSEPMKRFYGMASRGMSDKYDFADKPGIAVIALGTNDAAGGVEEGEFKEAAKEFINMVRNDAPNAKIIWMYGMMNKKFIPVLRELTDEMRTNDKNLSFLPIESVRREDNETGAFGHPNRKGQKRIADTLLSYIKSLNYEKE